jgi:hypothetical protein
MIFLKEKKLKTATKYDKGSVALSLFSGESGLANLTDTLLI